MDKTLYRVELVPGTDEAAFLETGDAASLEVNTNLNNFDNWVILNLTEEEATTLRESNDVVSVELQVNPIPFSYDVTEFQKYAGYRTSISHGGSYVNPSLATTDNGNSGDTHSPMSHMYVSGDQPDSQRHNDGEYNLGHFEWNGELTEFFTSHKHKLIGRYVDVVCLESNSDIQTSYNTDFENHENWTVFDPQTYELTFSSSGSSAYLVTGTHRGGSLNNASNPTIQLNYGDKLVITNTTSGHPIRIETQFPHGIPSSGNLRYRVEGNVNNENGGTVTLYADHFDEWGLNSCTYVCAFHPSMTGTIQFLKPSGSRLKRINWANYDSSANTPENNQLSNSELFGYHSAGVASSSAGLFTGYAKGSDIYIAYFGGGVAIEGIFNAVLNWHNSKAVNPATGKRNATVITGAWGYAWEFFDRLVPVNNITEIGRYTSDGTLVTTSRPGSGWGNDLSPFIDAGFNLRTASDPNGGGTKWFVTTREDNTRLTALDSVVNSLTSYDGVYFFRSAGNSACNYGHQDLPEWNNYIVQESGSRYVNINWSGGNSSIGGSGALSSPLTHYPLRTYDQGQTNSITIGAAQPSMLYPYPDSYSCRGPGIDIFAPGTMYYATSPDFNGYFGGNYMDGGSGDYYCYFSGTSNAAPVAAGIGACYIEDFFIKTGVYPSIAQLKTRMRNYARPRMKDDPGYDWSNAPSASTGFVSNHVVKGGFTNPDGFYSAYASTNETGIFAHPSGTVGNDDYVTLQLQGSTNLHVGLPWAIDRGNSGFHFTTVRGPIGKPKEAETGMLYPRYRRKLTG